jgi:hypothetical protein
MLDPKQASTKKSGQAWGWRHQKSIPQASEPVHKTGAQTSYRFLRAERVRFGAPHSPKVKVQSLKKAYKVLTLITETKNY